MNEKSRAIHHMKRLATSCLLIALTLRIAATWLPNTTWRPYLKAFTEAAVIGGLADWFAVTALFRHPLGIPLPHTRILANNQNRIAQSLSHFITENFLHPSLLSEKISHYQLSTKIASHLEKNAANYATKILHIAPNLFRTLHTPELEHALSNFTKKQIQNTPITPLAGRTLATLSPHFPKASQSILEFLLHFLQNNHQTLHTWLNQNLPLPETILGFPLGSLREKLGDTITTEALKRLSTNLQTAISDPSHPFSNLITQQLQQLPDQLQNNPKIHEKGEAIKLTILQNTNLEHLFSHLLHQLQNQLNTPSTTWQSILTQHISHFSQEILQNPNLQQQWNHHLTTFLQPILHNATPHLQTHIEQTVTQWNPEQLTDKLEQEVGRDLQFVRLNGTLVGGLLGLALHAILTFFP